MLLTLLQATLDGWRTEATLYRRRGQNADADRLGSLIEEIEAAIEAFFVAHLDLQDSAGRTGFSSVHLRRLTDEGKIRRVPHEAGVRIYVAQLPVKPGRLLTLLGAQPGDAPGQEPIDIQNARQQLRRELIRKLG